MKTLIALLQILPLIIQTALACVHALEAGFQQAADATGSKLAADGAQKAAVGAAALGVIMQDESVIAAVLPLDLITKIFNAVRDAGVVAFKAVGIIKPPAA